MSLTEEVMCFYINRDAPHDTHCTHVACEDELMHCAVCQKRFDDTQQRVCFTTPDNVMRCWHWECSGKPFALKE